MIELLEVEVKQPEEIMLSIPVKEFVPSVLEQLEVLVVVSGKIGGRQVAMFREVKQTRLIIAMDHGLGQRYWEMDTASIIEAIAERFLDTPELPVDDEPEKPSSLLLLSGGGHAER